MRGDLFARAAKIEEQVGTAEYAGVATEAWTRDKIGEVESMEMEITKLAKGLQDFRPLQTLQPWSDYINATGATVAELIKIVLGLKRRLLVIPSPTPVMVQPRPTRIYKPHGRGPPGSWGGAGGPTGGNGGPHGH